MAKYRYKQIWKDGRIFDEHRLVMEDYLGRPLTRYEVVHHINNDPRDNRIDNLELTTLSAHSRCHMKEGIKRSPIYGKGEQNHQAKLRETDIPIIRQLLEEGYGVWTIGKRFFVNHATIRDIRDGKTWVGV